MNDKSYERLLTFLSYDNSLDEPVSDIEVEEVLVEAASLMAALSSASDDLADSAIWQQVAEDAHGAPCPAASDELLDEPWPASGDEPQADPQRKRR